jgi:hypothetical protein
MRRFALSYSICALLAAAAAGQAPGYFVSTAVRPGEVIQTVLVGKPGVGFVSLADLDGGPSSLLGETFFVGFSPALVVVDQGVLPPSGLRVLSASSAGAPPGLQLYLQSCSIDPSAPNGGFYASDGESLTVYGSTTAMVEKFAEPASQGVTGTYDQSVRGRLQGAPVTHRSVEVGPGMGVEFTAPIFGPLNPHGVRQQMVYRAADLGATGAEEALVGLAWRPFGGQVTDDDFQRIAIDVSHSEVVPDYTIEAFSALPLSPSSGLASVFANNRKPGESPLTYYDGPYAIRAAELGADGYLDYPGPHQSFL